MTRPPRHDAQVVGPVYQRIAADLRERIRSGQLGPGDQLPTEQELVEHHTASRYTVRQAVAQLVSEGLVVARRPHGVFVRSWHRLIYRPQEEFEPAPSEEMDRFLGRLKAEGREPTQTIEVSQVQPPPVVADRLRTGDRAAVLRRRTRSIDGEPYHTNDSYFPLDLVTGSEIMLPMDIARGARQVLAERGAEEQRTTHEFVGRMPTFEESNRLELPPGSSVVEHICTGYTAAGDPVRCALSVLVGDRHTIVFELRRPEG